MGFRRALTQRGSRLPAPLRGTRGPVSKTDSLSQGHAKARRPRALRGLPAPPHKSLYTASVQSGYASRLYVGQPREVLPPPWLAMTSAAEPSALRASG